LLTTASSERRRLSSSWTSLICFVRRSCIQEDIWGCIFRITKVTQFCLTLILLTWRLRWATNNASKWQMGFNSAFKGLKKKNSSDYQSGESVEISIMAYTTVYPVSCLFVEKYHIRYYLYHTLTYWVQLIWQLYIAYTSTQKWELLHRDSNACRTDCKYILPLSWNVRALSLTVLF